MYIKAHHPMIFTRIQECRAAVGNETVSINTLSLYNGKAFGNFNWRTTKEGHDFWSKISRGDFETFYNKYVVNKNVDEYSII